MANYAEIVEIVAPDRAVQGGRVDVTVKIKNIWTGWFRIYCVAVVDSLRFIDWLDEVAGPGDTREFSGAFIMGGADVRILAQSWYEGGDGYLHRDDEKTRDVKVTALEPEFTAMKISNFSRV